MSRFTLIGKLSKIFFFDDRGRMVRDMLTRSNLPDELMDTIEAKIDNTQETIRILKVMVEAHEKELQRYLYKLAWAINKGKKK